MKIQFLAYTPSWKRICSSENTIHKIRQSWGHLCVWTSRSVSHGFCKSSPFLMGKYWCQQGDSPGTWLSLGLNFPQLRKENHQNKLVLRPTVGAYRCTYMTMNQEPLHKSNSNHRTPQRRNMNNFQGQNDILQFTGLGFSFTLPLCISLDEKTTIPQPMLLDWHESQTFLFHSRTQSIMLVSNEKT